MSRRLKKKAGLGKAAVMPSGTPVADDSNERWTVAGVCIFLAAVIWVVFGQTLKHEFVSFDDSDYVYENPVVQKGLTLRGIIWAFTHVYAHNWHPLTWISHMLDCQFYGLSPGGHHLTNILLHTVTAVLLFLVLRQLTGFLWRSAFVAAVFAVHPLHVESVAWVAERKDVLSGLFFMLTIGAYVRYVQKKSRVEGRVSSTQAYRALDPRLWTLDYYLVLLFFGLGLMCKPMLVTLPFVLLLLDYWPLGRVAGGEWRVTRFGVQVPQLHPECARSRFVGVRGSTLNHLLYEKLLLFGLATASCVVTIFAQTDAIQPFDQISLSLRVGNALISYVAYLGQMFWPSGLAVLYPFTTRNVGVSGVVLSLVLLAGISAGAFVLRRQRPYFLTGWLWYLIMLVPVIGILQVGQQARADRYTYLPQIGLYVLLTWAAADLCAGWRHRRVVLGGCAAAILVALIFCARTQVSYWRNSELLWTRALACTSDNAIAQNHLGVTLLQKGKVDEAIPYFQKALQIKPDNAEACYNLGNVLLQKGRVDEAIVHFQKVLQVKPNSAEASYNLGNALLKKGSVDEAIVHYQKALEINPNYADVQNNLGIVLLQKGRVDEAIVHFQKALQIKPHNAEAHYNLGIVLLQNGRVDEAITHFQKALEIKPDFAEAQNNLAQVLATSPQATLRDGNKAVKLAEQANQLTGGENPTILSTLAAAYAEAGRFPEAMETAQHALQLAETQSNTTLADAIRSQMKLYQAGLPFHLP